MHGAKGGAHAEMLARSIPMNGTLLVTFVETDCRRSHPMNNQTRALMNETNLPSNNKMPYVIPNFETDGTESDHISQRVDTLIGFVIRNMQNVSN